MTGKVNKQIFSLARKTKKKKSKLVTVVKVWSSLYIRLKVQRNIPLDVNKGLSTTSQISLKDYPILHLQDDHGTDK